MKKLLFTLLILLALTSCSKDIPAEPAEPNVSAEPEIIEPSVDDSFTEEPKVETPISDPIVEVPQFTSYTTGLGCTEEEHYTRPIAVMYNNNHVSYPQNCISFADIVYECDAEGGLTRLMAIFSDWKDLEEIGSVRSARDYFVSLSESHGSIYVNAGGSPSAYEKLINGHVDYIDGVNMTKLPKKTFYRSSERIRNNGYEHSLMTDGAKIADAVAFLEYPTRVDDGFEPPLKFSSDEVYGGNPCDAVTLKHSAYITTRFDYDSISGTFEKTSFGDRHTDGINGEQLRFKNVLILFVKERVVDDEGRLDVDLTSGGEGYYFTNGKYTEITWSRESDDSPFVFTDSNGELHISPGKTHITLFNKNNKNNISIK